ncbi:TPA: thymidylate kinase [Candidatus Falkowbacteria bacterium]|nr:MAG: Thymidylate kinase [Candidatus Falkowbacteria bacterium GW2011_GWF2_43_32]HBA36344.1 thymidylate kinase [Candidatus Falkowbacteria bacterium]
MNSNKAGKFIVIDGTDGSGKTTQLQLLKADLEARGYPVAVADFPQYNTKSAGAVEEYLSGKYGSAETVGPYKASIFYAVDRYDASFKIRTWLNEGKIVLANRYTSANMGHQGGKIDEPTERKKFFAWLNDLEYNIFGLPKPDLSIILYLQPEIAQQLAKQRKREDWTGKTQDIHEDNLIHLQKAAQVYREIAADDANFKLIDCAPNGKLFSREEIGRLVNQEVKSVINE